jgi:hypothetical protein
VEFPTARHWSSNQELLPVIYQEHPLITGSSSSSNSHYALLLNPEFLFFFHRGGLCTSLSPKQKASCNHHQSQKMVKRKAEEVENSTIATTNRRSTRRSASTVADLVIPNKTTKQKRTAKDDRAMNGIKAGKTEDSPKAKGRKDHYSKVSNAQFLISSFHRHLRIYVLLNPYLHLPFTFHQCTSVVT